MTQEPPKTISIPVPAALHSTVGIALVLAAITAFWAHFALPNGHAGRSATAAFGVLAGAAALIFWLWCGQQCNRTETKDVGDAVRAAEAKAAAREQELTAALEAATEQLDRNHAVIKELIGAVEALQDTYLREGKPPDHALQQEGPVPCGGTGPSSTR